MKKWCFLTIIATFLSFYAWSDGGWFGPACRRAGDYAMGCVTGLQQGGINLIGGAVRVPVQGVAQGVAGGIIQGHVAEFGAGMDAIEQRIGMRLNIDAIEERTGVRLHKDEMQQDYAWVKQELKNELALAENKVRNNYKKIRKRLFWDGLAVGGAAIGLFATYLIVKYGIPFAFRLLERRLMRPQLIVASSKKSISEEIINFFKPLPKPAFMVFAPELALRLNTIVQATQNINKKIKAGKTNTKYRNLMLYGPPGTGKTMFAKDLARQSGLEYAFMSGSAFAKFQEGEGIEALDDLFAWANRSKGLIIFIDEAETFLAAREKMDPNSMRYQLLNSFLSYTGERSSKFMLVFATNNKDAIDSGVFRRIDDLVEMPLPGLEERIRLLTLYRDTILMEPTQNDFEFIATVEQHFDQAKIKDVAKRTRGLSGGDLEGIINTIQADADVLDPAIVSPELIDSVVKRAIEKHKSLTGGAKIWPVSN